MTTSDAEGKYSFVGLPAGEYEVRVTKTWVRRVSGNDFFARLRARFSAQQHNVADGSVNEEIDVMAEADRKKELSKACKEAWQEE